MGSNPAVARGWVLRLRLYARLVWRLATDPHVLTRLYALVLGAAGVLLMYSASDARLSWMPRALVGARGTAQTIAAGGTLIAVAVVLKELAAIDAAAIGPVLRALAGGQMFLTIVVLLLSGYTGQAPFIVWPMLAFGTLFAYAGAPPQIPESSLYGSLLTLFGRSPTGLPPRLQRRRRPETRMRSRGVVMRDVEGLRSAYERQIREAARQEERHRLARDLHDAVKQQIFVIQTAAATAQARFEHDPGGARRAIGDVRDAARAAMSELEAMLDSLQARPLEPSGLVAALREQCSALGYRTGAHVEVQIGAAPATTPPGVTQALLRIAQEALANVARHARATRVDVALEWTVDEVTLSVRDNGVGFAADPARQGRLMGMANMAARASEFRGVLDVASEPDQGTTVRATLPLVSPGARAGAHLRWAALWAVMLLVVAALEVVARVRGEPIHPVHLALPAPALLFLAGHVGPRRAGLIGPVPRRRAPAYPEVMRLLTGVLLLLAALGCRREEPPPTAAQLPEARSASSGSAGPSGSRGNGVQRDPWRHAQSRGIEFRAVGQEPGWHLEIEGDRSMRLVYDYGERTIETEVTRTTDPAGRTVFLSTTEPDVVVTVEDRACRDVMSGQPFPSTVTVAIAPGADKAAPRRELRGCGRDPAAHAQWTASAHAVGPVRVGMSVAEAESAIGASLGVVGDESGECLYRRSPAAPAGVLFMQTGGRIARVDITSFAVRTDLGIGAGDSEDRVREAYGAAVESLPHKYTPGGHYLTVAADANHRMVFETDGQWVTRYRIGRVPEVDWIEGCS